MKNRNVGYLIVGIALLIMVIIFLFNKGLQDIVATTCSHGPTCTMYDTISIQTYLSLSHAGLVLLIGLFFIFSKESEKIVIKKVKEKNQNKKLNTSSLDSEEKKVISILQQESGAVFQSTLSEHLGIGKVKMTRLMDKLESKGFIERKRRGMNNIIVLKS